MLRIWADEVFSIGLIAGVPQPVVVSTRLRNVPVEGMYNWDPGAHFGMYKPDTFWLDDTPAPAASVERRRQAEDRGRRRAHVPGADRRFRASQGGNITVARTL